MDEANRLVLQHLDALHVPAGLQQQVREWLCRGDCEASFQSQLAQLVTQTRASGAACREGSGEETSTVSSHSDDTDDADPVWRKARCRAAHYSGAPECCAADVLGEGEETPLEVPQIWRVSRNPQDDGGCEDARGTIASLSPRQRALRYVSLCEITLRGTQDASRCGSPTGTSRSVRWYRCRRSMEAGPTQSDDDLRQRGDSAGRRVLLRRLGGLCASICGPRCLNLQSPNEGHCRRCEHFLGPAAKTWDAPTNTAPKEICSDSSTTWDRRGTLAVHGGTPERELCIAKSGEKLLDGIESEAVVLCDEPKDAVPDATKPPPKKWNLTEVPGGVAGAIAAFEARGAWHARSAFVAMAAGTGPSKGT